MSSLRFKLDLRRTADRRIPVELVWTLPAGAAAEHASAAQGPPLLFFPVWTPGSYLIREFARQVSELRAEDDSGAPLQLLPLSKNRWQLDRWPHGSVRISYSVYAHELTVRTADVGARHAFWNGACVYLWPVGHEQTAATIQATLPAGWDLVSQLPAESTPSAQQPNGAKGGGNTVCLRAANLDEAIDAPCLAGEFTRIPFDVDGVPHEYAVHGLDGAQVPESLVLDTVRIIQEAKQVFGDGLPYERYRFLLLLTDAGGGGLEHTESSTLLAPRTTFREGRPYRGLMGLVAHEHFHAWNIKRMRPEGLWSLDYERECYTDLLWVAEGFTAYYDELLCLRAQVHNATTYLRGLADVIQGLASNPGRLKLSLSQSSRDAWVRLYRADEDTRNTSQNYYTNGSLAALALDLTIRIETGGARSLDDAMRMLWQSTWQAGRPYSRADVDRCLSDAAGKDLAPFIASMVDGPFEPDLRPLIEALGVAWQETTAADKAYLGVTLRKGTMTVIQVVAGGPADLAGVCPQDELIAINGLRADSESWESVLDTVAQPEQSIELLLARRGRITRARVQSTQAPASLTLTPAETASEAQERLRHGWLGC